MSAAEPAAGGPIRPGIPQRKAEALSHHRAGRLAEAEALYRSILADDPREPDALHFLGLVAYQSGRPGEAIELVQKAVQRRPRVAPLHNSLGLAHQAAGDETTAEWAFRHALSIDPSFAEAHVNLGNVLRRRGDKDAALEHYRAAAAANPGYAEAAGYLGLLLAELGRPAEALAPLERANALRPGHAELLAALGGALADLKRPEAEERLRQSLALEPERAGALCHLGRHLIATARPEEGFACLAKAAEGSPRDARVRAILGRALEAAGRTAEAAAEFAAAVDADPGFAHGWLGRGRCSRALGRFEEAFEHYLKALELDPGGGEALPVIASGKLARLDEGRLAGLERAVDDASVPAERRIRLHAALASLREIEGSYDAAFGHIEAFNRLRREDLERSGRAYDEAKDVAMTGRLIGAFDAAFFGRVAGSGAASELPVFIVGMPRSGTTLVEQVLASHSRVHAAGEMREISILAAGLARELAQAGLAVAGAYPECVAGLGGPFVEATARKHLAYLSALAPDAARVTDKMPGNYNHLGLIAALFPKAKIIHCRRDPVDTCLSCYAQNFRADFPWAWDQAALGRHWRLYDALMRHWRRQLPVPMLEVGYEDLVADFEKGARAIIAFCGLDWEDACLAFHETERPVRTASDWQVRRPLYRTSVGRWRRFERHLRPLVDALGDAPRQS